MNKVNVDVGLLEAEAGSVRQNKGHTTSDQLTFSCTPFTPRPSHARFLYLSSFPIFPIAVRLYKSTSSVLAVSLPLSLALYFDPIRDYQTPLNFSFHHGHEL